MYGTKIMIVVGAFIASGGVLLARYGGKSVDFSQGVIKGVCDGYLWVLGIGLSWVAGMLFALYITKNEISSTMSFYVPLVYLMTFLGGVLLLKESVNADKVIGSAFLAVGLFFMLRSG